MKRFRLSTLLLLVIIVALGMGLMIEHRRADRHETAYLRAMRERALIEARHAGTAANLERLSETVRNMNKRMSENGIQ